MGRLQDLTGQTFGKFKISEDYHYGDLSCGKKSETRKEITNSRNSGGFGTGFYTIGHEAPNSYYAQNRELWEIDLDKYNLYRPKTVEDGHKLHDALKNANKIDDNSFKKYDKIILKKELANLESREGNKGIISFIKKYYPQILNDNELRTNIKNNEWEEIKEYAIDLCDILDEQKNILNQAIDMLSEIFNLSKQEVEKKLKKAYNTNSEDSPSTLFMKSLGYEGINVSGMGEDSGMSGLDNFQYGSVVYDLKPNSYRKIKNGDLKPLEEEITETTEQEIIDEYGITNRWEETGFILTNGKQIDLSGKRLGARGGKRTVDHREPFEDGTDDLIKFIAQGNIRVLPEYSGINLTIEPTEQQYQKIKEMIMKLGYANDYFSIDFDDKNGNTKASKVYPENINVKKIIDDIKFYFKNGKLPYESELSRFREDLEEEEKKEIEMSNEYDSEGNQLTKAQADFFRNSKVRDDKGRLLVCYHGTDKEFSEFDKKRIKNGTFGNGFYFTTSKQSASQYGKNIKGCYLNAKKIINIPEEFEDITEFVIEEMNMGKSIQLTNKEATDILIHRGYDAITTLMYYNDDNFEYYVVFEPNQIKSITNKEPTNSNNINEKLLQKTIAYHGSQQDNLEIEDRPLYLTNNKEIAIDFAEGYNFGYRIREEEKPTVYTIEIDNGNYKEVTTEEEYEEIMDIVNIEDTLKKYADYDGIIYEDENGLIYYLVFEPNKKCRIIEKEIINEKLQERLEGIKPEMWVTDNPYDIKRLIENKPKQYRILYDKNLDLYAICDSERYIHYDMIERLDRMGYLYKMQDFIEEIGTLENYIEFGQDGGWLDDNWVEPYLIYMVFTDKDDFALGDDDYDKEYKYPFGTIFTRHSDLEDCELYKILEKGKDK